VFVSGEGLGSEAAAGAAPCTVPALDQFQLTWFKHKDLAMVKLKRTAPAECMGLGGGGSSAPTPGGGVELRVPLPEVRPGTYE
jgi:hypothetical protein